MKRISLVVLISLTMICCDGPEQNTAVGNSVDSVVVDPVGDTRGSKGTGVDNSGGTPGPGTITDTFQGKIDTADHTSKKNPIKK